MTFAEHFANMWWAYVVIFVMICLSAYFSASEIAFNSANKMRLRKAAELLVNTGLSVKEIASRSGWEDEYYFSRQFKMNYHLSPGQYRRESSGTI